MPDDDKNASAHTLSTIVELQKRLIETLGGLKSATLENKEGIERAHRDINRVLEGQIDLQSEIKALSRDLIKVRGEISERFVAVGRRFDEADSSIDLVRQEVATRSGALIRRFDEVDNSIDSLRGDIRSATSEILAQDLQTLNAVQEALSVARRVSDMENSVEEIRNGMGM